MRKNKGVTLIALIITIIVLLILSTIFIATGLDALKEAKNSKISNEISQLKKAMADEYTNYVKNEDVSALIGTLAKDKWSEDECINKVISSLNEEENKELQINKIKNDIKRDYDDYVMIIGSGDMSRLGLENYSKENVYIVNYYTNDVYGPIQN